jgi:hypothetical protein
MHGNSCAICRGLKYLTSCDHDPRLWWKGQEESRRQDNQRTSTASSSVHPLPNNRDPCLVKGPRWVALLEPQLVVLRPLTPKKPRKEQWIRHSTSNPPFHHRSSEGRGYQSLKFSKSQQIPTIARAMGQVKNSRGIPKYTSAIMWALTYLWMLESQLWILDALFWRNR